MGDLIVELAREANEPKAKQRIRDEAEVRHVKTQLQELFRLKLDGLITDDEFLAKKSSFVSRQSTLEAAIVDLVLDENSIRSKLTEITDPLISLSKTWDALPIQLKRRFKQFLLGFGYLRRSIRTTETPILFKLFHPFPTSNAHLVARTGGSWNQIVQEIEEFAELIREWRGEKTAA